MAEDDKSVLIVGAGLCGSLAAISLGNRGFNVTLVEGRKDWRVDASAAIDKGEDQSKSAIKRSINLALSKRGQDGLKSVGNGVLEKVMKDAIPMYCRGIHSSKADGNADVVQRYDEIDSSNAIWSVSREGLNNLLIAEADKLPNVTVKFGHRLTHIAQDGTAHFNDFVANPPASSPATYNDYTPGDVQIKPRLIIGADGAYSGTREAMLRMMPLDFKRQYITHGYKELTIPPTADGEYAMQPVEALHIWPRGDFMMIGLPNPDKSFTCTLFAPFSSSVENGKAVPGMLDQKTPEQITAYFEEHFADAIPLMPDYVAEYQRNPACRLVMVQARPWNFKDRVLLLGDSAHAMVPFYGQGMNAAFEDVLTFCQTLDAHGLDLATAVPAFAKARQPAGEAIAQLSLNNYVEMRHHTADPWFRYRKKVEGVLNWLLPETWVPLYKMVAFTRIPYHEAITRAEAQDRILNRTFNLCSLAAVGGIAALAARRAGLL